MNTSDADPTVPFPATAPADDVAGEAASSR